MSDPAESLPLAPSSGCLLPRKFGLRFVYLTAETRPSSTIPCRVRTLEGAADIELCWRIWLSPIPRWRCTAGGRPAPPNQRASGSGDRHRLEDTQPTAGPQTLRICLHRMIHNSDRTRCSTPSSHATRLTPSRHRLPHASGLAIVAVRSRLERPSRQP